MIPLLDLPRMHEPIQEALEAAAAGVLRHGKFIMGPEVSAFEKQLAEICGVPYAISCASGSDALLIALMALDLEPGDEVITTPYSFFSTVSSITRLGLKPVFVDINSDTFNIETASVEAAITPRTRVVMPVHLFGQTMDIESLVALCAPRNIRVIEDAAQALGARRNGKMAGTFGEIGCYSFFPSKNIGGFGDGGALVTSDEHLARRLGILRLHGAEPKYHHSFVGVNSRMDTMQAALLSVKLPMLEEISKIRAQNAAFYLETLQSVGGLTLPMPPEEGSLHVWNQFVIRLEERDRVRAELTGAGIGTEIYYPVPLHLQKCFAFLGHGAGDFPHAERTAGMALAIPVFNGLRSDERALVAESIKGFSIH